MRVHRCPSRFVLIRFPNGAWTATKISDATGWGLYLLIRLDPNRPGKAGTKLWCIWPINSPLERNPHAQGRLLHGLENYLY